MIGKIFAYWKTSKQTKVLVNKSGLFQIQLGGSGGVPIPGTFCNFYTHLRLETVFSAFKLTQNCYVTMNISFS